jgi:hypothetical protein
MLAQKHHYGLRPEFGLIEISLIMTAFALFILSDYIQPAGSINEYLISISLILCIFGIGALVISVLYKYFIDESQ